MQLSPRWGIAQPSKVPVHSNENGSFEDRVIKSVDEVGLTEQRFGWWLQSLFAAVELPR